MKCCVMGDRIRNSTIRQELIHLIALAVETCWNGWKEHESDERILKTHQICGRTAGNRSLLNYKTGAGVLERQNNKVTAVTKKSF